MYRFRFDYFDGLSFQPCKILLFGSWLAGLISGIAFSYCSGNFVSLMHGAPVCTLSIVGLGAVLLLPYLLSAFAVFTYLPGLLIPLAFAKAFLFGACAAAVDLCYSSAGWIIKILLMFSSSSEIPVLYWLWLRCLDGDKRSPARILVIVFIILVVIGSIDLLVIAPFLASVI